MDLKKILDELFEECKHGDQEHQDWLREKFNDFGDRKIKEERDFLDRYYRNIEAQDQLRKDEEDLVKWSIKRAAERFKKKDKNM